MFDIFHKIIYLIQCLGLKWFLKAKLGYGVVAKNDGVVVFNVARQITTQLHIEYFLAHIIAKSGRKVVMLIDDGLLQHWDSIHQNNQHKIFTPMHGGWVRRFYTLRMTEFVQWVYATENLESVYYSELLKCSEVKPPVEFQEIINRHARGSCRRFSSDRNFWQSDESRSYQRKSQNNGEVAACLATSVLRKYNVENLITSHGIYSTWGVFFDILKQHGVKSRIYSELPYRKQGILISDVPAQLVSFDETFSSYLETNLIEKNPVRLNRAKKILAARTSYKGDDSEYYYGEVFEQFNFTKSNENSTVFGMFPNIVWDGDIDEWNHIFDSVLDWVIQTIYLFQGSPNELVIRCHPSEATLVRWAVRLEELINELVPEIGQMPNVHIISSSLSIDTFKFIEDNIDVGLVYDGIIAAEMVSLGIPVISCANSRYKNAEFCLEVKSLAEYQAFVNEPRKAINEFRNDYENRLARLFVFIDWYFFEKCHIHPLIDANDFFGIDLNVYRSGFGNADFDHQCDILIQKLV